MARRFLWLSLLFAVTAWAGGTAIPQARDLRAEGSAAAGRGLPLMIMFYEDGCGWCARMEREYLDPMQRSGSYADKVVMVRVALDPDFSLTGFDGRRSTGAALAQRYGVSVVPTLVFVDGNGEQMAERMVGLGSPDYFGLYLDEAIDTAGSRLRSQGPVARAGSP